MLRKKRPHVGQKVSKVSELKEHMTMSLRVTVSGEKVEETFGKKENGRENSQGKDPRTFDEHSQGGDLSTPEATGQGKDPRTFEEPVERWRVQKMRKERHWKKKKKKKKKRRKKEEEEEKTKYREGLGGKSAKKGSQASSR